MRENSKGKNFLIALVVILLITGLISGIIYLATKSFEKNVDKGEIVKAKEEVSGVLAELKEKLDKINQGEVIPPEKKKKLEEVTKVIVKNSSEKKLEKPKINISKKNLKNGTIYDYYVDGTIKREQNYVDGIKNGKEVEYYSNGKIKYEVDYINGFKNGSERYYYSLFIVPST